jgi:hypothetical protein
VYSAVPYTYERRKKQQKKQLAIMGCCDSRQPAVLTLPAAVLTPAHLLDVAAAWSADAASAGPPAKAAWQPTGWRWEQR